MDGRRLPYVWDYDIDEAMFRDLLAGRLTLGRLNRDWAAVRLLEYAPYREIVRVLGFKALVEGWPRWRARIRAQDRKRGFDFLVEWLPVHHPELLVVFKNGPYWTVRPLDSLDTFAPDASHGRCNWTPSGSAELAKSDPQQRFCARSGHVQASRVSNEGTLYLQVASSVPEKVSSSSMQHVCSV